MHGGGKVGKHRIERERESGENGEDGEEENYHFKNQFIKITRMPCQKFRRRIDFCLELQAISFVCKFIHVKSSKRFFYGIGRKILLLLFCVGIKSDQPLKWKEKLWQSDAIMPLKLV